MASYKRPQEIILLINSIKNGLSDTADKKTNFQTAVKLAIMWLDFILSQLQKKCKGIYDYTGR